MQEQPSEEQRKLILRNWVALQRSRTSVEKAKYLMMESLSDSSTDRNLNSYNRRTMLVWLPTHVSGPGCTAGVPCDRTWNSNQCCIELAWLHTVLSGPWTANGVLACCCMVTV